MYTYETDDSTRNGAPCTHSYSFILLRRNSSIYVDPVAMVLKIENHGYGSSFPPFRDAPRAPSIRTRGSRRVWPTKTHTRTKHHVFRKRSFVIVVLGGLAVSSFCFAPRVPDSAYGAGETRGPHGTERAFTVTERRNNIRTKQTDPSPTSRTRHAGDRPGEATSR